MGKHKKKHKKSKRRKSSSDESSSETEWVEKTTPDSQTSPKATPKFQRPDLEREDWLNLSSVIASTSNADRRTTNELEKRRKKLEDQYNPSKSSRELNPYWKDGGTGLPTFKKPSDDFDCFEKKEEKRYNWKASKSSSKIDNEKEVIKLEDDAHNKTKSTSRTVKETVSPSLDPNAIAAKIVKAEIMGNTKLVEELKIKLEEAKQNKLSEEEGKKEILLTQTDSKGFSRPLKVEDNEHKKKKRKVETYSGGERTKYYADDDKYSLKDMFESEKYNSADSSNKEFMKMAGGIKKNDTLEDIFVDKIRNQGTSKEVDKAINEQNKIVKSVDNCTKCLQSENMLKNLIIDYNENVHLSLPNHEPLTDGHCLIIPVRHVSCSVQLDENEWSEINRFRSKLVNLFEKQDKTVIFFEIAKSFHKYPHMVLECIPLPRNKCELAPIYFKKAIEESETEWSHNKKLISLKNRDVIKAVPKGLPYFFVSFGMSEGFAHVIEDQSMFPTNFAQEIIGGMLDIHHSKWRRPRKDSFDSQKSRVSEFKKWWRNE